MSSKVDRDNIVRASESDPVSSSDSPSELPGRRELLLSGAAGILGLLIASEALSQSPSATPQPTPAPSPGILGAPLKSEPSAFMSIAPSKVPGSTLPAFSARSTATLMSDTARPPASVFARSSNDENAWKSIKTKVRSEFRVTSDGTSVGSLSTFARSITSNLRIEAKADQFNSLHVEPLIDQAADLLDRGVKDRTAWDELAVKWTNLNLEMNEYVDLDEIHREEERDGLYDVPFQQSVAAYNSEVAYSWGLNFSEYKIRTWFEFLYGAGKFEEYVNAAALGGWIGGCVPWTFNGQSFAGYAQHTFNNVQDTVANHGMNSAAITARKQFNEGYASMDLMRDSTNTLYQCSKSRLPGLLAKMNWDAKNASFQRRRTAVARKYQDLKAKAASDIDGLLNYQKRLIPLRERFQDDFNHALSRLTAVQQGLVSIYGYDGPSLPAPSKEIDYFDKCLQWTRNAIQWLIRFSRMDQNVVFPISVRSLIGGDMFKDGRKDKSWQFRLGNSNFPEMAHVRLRGISSYVMPTAGNEPRVWGFSLAVPKAGLFYHLNGTNHTVDQSKVPPCRLYRVVRRIDIRESDVAGATALFNASPIGLWTVTLDGAIPIGEDYSDLHDIHIDLHLAYRDTRLK